MTEALFRDNPYTVSTTATIAGLVDGGIVLDRSLFYPAGGGQPGDRGMIELDDGRILSIRTTAYAPDRSGIVLMVETLTDADGDIRPAGPEVLAGLELGTAVMQRIDWDYRYRLMRMHTAMHLLSVVLPYAVTGGQVGEEESRLDFDLSEGASVDKIAATAGVMALVEADHAVTTEWITDDELAANPGLVKTMKVKPPTGSGRVRLVRIGEDVDLQPCGGTHVRSTAEIGAIHIAKVENKGRINRRVRLRFGPLPTA